MTVAELKMDLICYQKYFNPECDIFNLSLDELAEFLTVQEEYNRIYTEVLYKDAPILKMFD